MTSLFREENVHILHLRSDGVAIMGDVVHPFSDGFFGVFPQESLLQRR